MTFILPNVCCALIYSQNKFKAVIQQENIKPETKQKGLSFFQQYQSSDCHAGQNN
jgi:hypothetical protein